MTIEPGEIIALAIGVLAGCVLQRPIHADDCACPSCARDRWRSGGDAYPHGTGAGLPPRKPHNMMESDLPRDLAGDYTRHTIAEIVAPLAKPNPAAHGHMPGHGFDLLGLEMECCREARAAAARCRASAPQHGPSCACPPLTPV